MIINGIRILDDNFSLQVTLSNILSKITNGKNFTWVLLFLDGMPLPAKESFVNKFIIEVNNSERGVFIEWKELENLSDLFFQMYEVKILGSPNIESLHRYKTDNEMYQSCDIVIELIDCAFWEIHSKNNEMINVLSKEFEKTELLKLSI